MPVHFTLIIGLLSTEVFIVVDVCNNTELYRERSDWKREGLIETCHTTTLVSITLIVTGGGLAFIAKPNV
jgi:hypothetical protein